MTDIYRSKIENRWKNINLNVKYALAKKPGLLTFIVLSIIAAVIFLFAHPTLKGFLHRANYDVAFEYTREQSIRIARLLEQELASGQSADIVLDQFQYMLEHSPQNASQFVCIVDADNKIIAHPDLTELNKFATGITVETPQGIVPFEYSAKEGVPIGGLQSRPNGIQDVVYQQPVSGLTWSVCVHIAHGLIMARTTAQLFAIYTVIGPLALLLVILSSLGARQVGRWFERKLVLANEKLAMSHNALERRVGERTSQLVEVNRQLQIQVEEKDKKIENNLNFLANVSHELRTPLNAILGYSEAMSMQIFGPIENEKYREYLKHIRTSVRHLTGILNEILDLSKLQTSNRILQEEITDITSLVEEAFVIVGPTAHQQEIELLHNGGPTKLFIDAGAFRQVLVNLLSNAIKFTEDKSPVTVSWSIEGDQFLIKVIDSGTGIPSTDLNKVMQPFEQSQATSRHASKGTGLGLPIANALVLLHGGKLTLERGKAGGTVATVAFSIKRVHGPADHFKDTA